MKRSLLICIVILFAILGCEKSDNEVFLKFSDGHEYGFSDIELYDTSSHVVYFKDVHDEFMHMDKGTFMFYYKGEPIYMGTLWPGYSSLGPTSPFIMTPSHCNHALRIESWQHEIPDVRNDPKMVALLSQHNLLHSGLAITSSSVEITGTSLTFSFTIKNMDESNLLIIDPDKTGLNLFHYFTNGLYIYDQAHNEVFSGHVTAQVPDPYNIWKTEWLSELKSGESKSYSINYSLSSSINPGLYLITFNFPGLHFQVQRDQLYQGSSRIWLGDIKYEKRIIIQ